MANETQGQSDQLAQQYETWRANAVGQKSPILEGRMDNGNFEATISSEALQQVSYILGQETAECIVTMKLYEAEVQAGGFQNQPLRKDFTATGVNGIRYFDPEVGKQVVEKMFELQHSWYDNDAVSMYRQFRAYVLSVIHNTDNYPNLRRNYPIPFSLNKHDIDELLHQIYPTVIKTLRLTRGNLPKIGEGNAHLMGVLFAQGSADEDERDTDILPVVAAVPTVAGAANGKSTAKPKNQPKTTQKNEASGGRLSKAVLPIILGVLVATSVFGFFAGNESQRNTHTTVSKGNSKTTQSADGNEVVSPNNPFVLTAAQEKKIVDQPTVIDAVFTLYHEVYPNSSIQTADQLIRNDPQWVLSVLGYSPVANTFATRSVQGAENELAINTAHPGYLNKIQLYYRNQAVSSRDWLKNHRYINVGDDGVISFTRAFFNQVREMPLGTNEYNPLAMYVIGMYNDYSNDPGSKTQFMAEELQAAQRVGFDRTMQAAITYNVGVRGNTPVLV